MDEQIGGKPYIVHMICKITHMIHKIDQELKKARRSGTSNILSMRNLKPGQEYFICELCIPLFSDNRFLVVSEKSKETTIDNSSKYSILKFPNKSKFTMTRDGIKEFRTSDGRLLMRQKVAKARREATSNVLSLTGFIEAGKYYMITDMGPAIHIKEFKPTYDDVETEIQEAEKMIQAVEV